MAIAMTDRLRDLRGRQFSSTGAYEPLERAASEYMESSVDLNRVLLSVNELTTLINKVSALTEDVKINNGNILTSFQNQTARDDNERLNDEIKSISQQCHQHLKKMKAELDSEESSQNRNSADFRIRKAQYQTLARRFKEVMEEYNEVEQGYREKTKERIQKQLAYAGQTVSEDKLEEIITKDPQIFAQDLLLHAAQRSQVLGECETRHAEIIQLESNIRELHQMFLDMALLVDEQGELIDVIERNVENAGVYASQARRHIGRAVVVSRKNTRLRWCIGCCVCWFCIGLIILVAVIGVVVFIVLRNMEFIS